MIESNSRDNEAWSRADLAFQQVSLSGVPEAPGVVLDVGGQTAAFVFPRKLAPGRYVRIAVSDAGSVFFESSDSLIPGASGGIVRVFEYSHGGITPISPLAGSTGARFVDASESGNDVFFQTFDTVIPNLSTNPHLRFYHDRRGYTRTTISRTQIRADFRAVASVTEHGSPVSTVRSFAILDGQPGLQAL